MMVVNAGRRHILLGLFPVPLFHSEYQSDPRSDAVIPLFWPQLGPTRSQIPAGSDVGSPEQCLLSGYGLVISRIWGLKESKVPPLPPARAPSRAQGLDQSRGGRGREASRPQPCTSSRESVDVYGAEGPVLGRDARDLRPPGGAR